jgi:competence protein ComEC
VIGVLTNLLAVPLSGPILTLGLVGSVLGNVTPALAYLLNASNGFLVTLLVWIARAASSFPFATATTPGVTLHLVSLFYAGCVPAALCGSALPERQAPLWATVLVMWVVLWLVLVSAGGL